MPSTKALWRLTVRAPVEDEEAINERFLAITGSYPATRQLPRSRTVHVEAYFKSRVQTQAARRLLKPYKPQVSVLPYENWAESWKRNFPVQRIGRRIIIKPSWRTHRARNGQAVIELDPGMSFGTGQHATTRFCLKMIERLAAPARSLLDVGTGSGILSIAAAKLGCSPICAVDNDPIAVRIARENARLNGTRFPIRVAALQELITAKENDIVAANILADVLLAYRRKLAALVAEDGFLILAGILTREAPQVRRAFTSLRFKVVACETKGNWTGLVLSKKAT